MSSGAKVKIGIGELRVGHYVDLDLSWTQHPFLFSNFRVSSADEIAVIRELGLSQVTIIPERSDRSLFGTHERPDPHPHQVTATASPAPLLTAPLPPGRSRNALWNHKRELVQRAAGFRDQRAQLAARYADTVKKINAFARDVHSVPANAVLAAEEIVEGMAVGFERNSSVLLSLVNLNSSDFTMHSHALNVTVLSMMLGRYLGLSADELRMLGMGAIVHDIGKIEIPTQITTKTTPLNHSEAALLQTHTRCGSHLVQRIGALPPAVIEIIERHHEALDGSGYPHGLKGAQLSVPVRIVSIANVYDNLTNPPDSSKALSPRDAMAVLFTNYVETLDADLVNKFILAMGVYPPGTVVRLSDDNIGMVVSVNPDHLLRPGIILYNPDIPRLEALMIDLRERPDIQIRSVLKPREFPLRIYEYLGISERLGYFYKSPDDSH